MGIGFQNDKTGWTTFTDGASLPSTVKSTDGGATWNQVKNQTGIHFMPLAITAKKGEDTGVASVGALESDSWSVDGDTFQQSKTSPLIAASQDVKFQGDKVWLAGPNGPCLSEDAGATYKCITVPLVNAGTGRYVSSPAENVIYFTAGMWPADSSQRVRTEGAEKHHQLTRVLKTVHNSETRATRYEFTTDFSANDDPPLGYVAELWKSTDNGATWKSLLSNTGDWYFNDIHCIDETHCVTVAEGFAQDGSSDP